MYSLETKPFEHACLAQGLTQVLAVMGGVRTPPSAEVWSSFSLYLVTVSYTHLTLPTIYSV